MRPPPTVPPPAPAANAEPATTAQSIAGPVLVPSVAVATLRIAIGLGIAADLLLRGGPGLALPIWMALVALGVIAVLWRADRALRRETVVWLGVAIIFAAGCAWRGEPLNVFDLLVSLAALMAAALTIHDDRMRLFALRVRELAWGVARTIAGSIVGIAPYALWDLRGEAAGEHWVRHSLKIVRTIGVVAVLAFVFGGLLRGADPIFASFINLPEIDTGTVVSHVFLIGFFSWGLAGAMRSTLANPSPENPVTQLPPIRIGMLETTAALLTLDILFAAFVAVQLGWLFGGEAFLRARTGLTAAEYARSGFFQTVWTVFLLVPLLVALRAGVSNNPSTTWRNTILSLPLMGLVGIVILSAVLRMRLYVHYFGMSTDRFYALVFLLWLGAVLTWLATTIISHRERAFLGGAIASGLVMLGALNVAAPDIIVARMNVERARVNPNAQQALDLEYLAGLSGEAIPIAVTATLRSTDPRDLKQQCAAAAELIRRWGPKSGAYLRARKPGAWRTWNASDQSGLRAVADHYAELKGVVERGGCLKPMAPAPNPQRQSK